MEDETDAPAADLSGVPAGEGASGADIVAVAASPDDTRLWVVRRTGRGYTSVRSDFVQKHHGPIRASTLARFCKNRKRRALILYLLLLTLWDPQGTPYPSGFWLRALQVTSGDLTWSKSSLSATWATLVDMGLATRKRTRRMADVVPRREDGEANYEAPTGNKIINRYFTLPGAFWTEKYFDTLSLPAICVLLIVLKETNDKDDEIHLTYPQFDEWYGISASSAQKGIAELEAAKLLTTRKQPVKAESTDAGFTVHHYYQLTGEFSRIARAQAREEASKAARSRAAKGAASLKNTKGKKSAGAKKPPTAQDAAKKKIKKEAKKTKKAPESSSAGARSPSNVAATQSGSRTPWSAHDERS